MCNSRKAKKSLRNYVRHGPNNEIVVILNVPVTSCGDCSRDTLNRDSAFSLDIVGRNPTDYCVTTQVFVTDLSKVDVEVPPPGTVPTFKRRQRKIEHPDEEEFDLDHLGWMTIPIDRPSFTPLNTSTPRSKSDGKIPIRRNKRRNT